MRTQVATKEDLQEVQRTVHVLEPKVSTIEKALGGLTKLIKDYHQEMVVFTHKVEPMEAWIKVPRHSTTATA